MPIHKKKLAMKKTNCLPILLFLFTAALCRSQSSDLLIRNINLIEVETGRARQADVLIEGQQIKAVSEKIETASVQKEIDGTGKWLIPGLVDAHIHFFQSGGL